MKKLFLLLFAVALGSAVMAQYTGSNYGHGNDGQRHATEYNQAYIGQVGALGMFEGKNDAFIDQTGSKGGKAFIYQNGYDNEAYIGQRGRGNVAGSDVWGCLDLCCPRLDFGVGYDGQGAGGCVELRDIQLLCKTVCTPNVRLRLPWVGYGIVQLGMWNKASIEQCGEYNKAGIKQEGVKLEASIVQKGKRNTALIYMKQGSLMGVSKVKQVQKGECDFAYTALYSMGGYNRALIIQEHTKGNHAVQKAKGRNLTLGILQTSEFGSRYLTGEGNVAVQLVEGRDLRAFIEQKGDDNKAVELVAGKCNIAAISQWGDNNHAMIKQGNPFD